MDQQNTTNLNLERKSSMQKTKNNNPSIKIKKFLYSGRVIDNTTIQALNEIIIKASQATKETQEVFEIFMDYLSTNPNAKIKFRASDMQLFIDSDAAYLIHPKARSREGGYHYLGNIDGKLFNRPIYIY